MMVFFHVARNTYRECLREPIFYVLLFSAVFIIGLFPSLAMFVFFEQAKLVADSSMATTLTFGLLAAALSASQVIARETRGGAIALLLSKPVPRWVFVTAKMAGLLTALTLFALVCVLASLLALRVAVDQFRLDFPLLYTYFGMMGVASVFGMARNYYARAPFASAAIYALTLLFFLLTLQSHFLPFGGEAPPPTFKTLPAFALLFFAIWMMGALTVVLATRLRMVPNLIACSSLFFLGLVSNYLIGRHVDSGLLFRALYAIIPNWQFFWMADALSSQSVIPGTYLLWAMIYTSTYVVMCAVIAVLLFRDREIGDARE